MKPLITSLVALTLVLGSWSNAHSVGAGRGIGTEESCHNFSHEEWLPVPKLCVVCHIPHSGRGKNKAKQYPEGLAWNPPVTELTFNIYNSMWSTSLLGLRDTTWKSNITFKEGGIPDSLSKLCLSCHDGIIAPNVFNLHHFVSMDFDRTRTELRDPDSTEMGGSGPISYILFGGKVQCPSCHDPHDEVSVAGTKLLRAEKERICWVCHRR